MLNASLFLIMDSSSYNEINTLCNESNKQLLERKEVIQDQEKKEQDRDTLLELAGIIIVGIAVGSLYSLFSLFRKLGKNIRSIVVNLLVEELSYSETHDRCLLQRITSSMRA